MKTKPIKLARDERIVAVVPEYASGPGWSNRPLWVYIVNSSKQVREECIQPEEQTPEMHVLFSPGAAMCQSLIGCIPVKRARKDER